MQMEVNLHDSDSFFNQGNHKWMHGARYALEREGLRPLL